MFHRYLGAVLIAILLFVSCRSEKEPQNVDTVFPADKVLILTETEGYRHTSIGDGLNMFNTYATEWNITVTHAAESDILLSDDINRFDVIVLLNTTGDYLSTLEEATLQRYLTDGGAILGIHAATDAEYDWDWYGYMLGAWFDSHPEIQTASCQIVDANHPITIGLPDRWIRTDEWYNFKNMMLDNNILVSIDEQTYAGGTNGELHPISWYRTIEKGRVFYTAMGHTESTYREPLFILQIRNALTWLTEKD